MLTTSTIAEIENDLTVTASTAHSPSARPTRRARLALADGSGDHKPESIGAAVSLNVANVTNYGHDRLLGQDLAPPA